MNAQDSQALTQLVHDKGLKAFLWNYCSERAEEMNRQCAQRMRPPADQELAAAYAAQAEVYERFVSDLEELERKK